MTTQDVEWTLRSAALPIAWAFSFCFTCLVIGITRDLSRWTVTWLLLASAYGAFQTSENFSPDDELNDTYSRFVIILSSHMEALCFMREGRVTVCTRVNAEGILKEGLRILIRLPTTRTRKRIHHGAEDGSVHLTLEGRYVLGKPLPMAPTEEYCGFR
jgi:hypothetical protein